MQTEKSMCAMCATILVNHHHILVVTLLWLSPFCRRKTAFAKFSGSVGRFGDKATV